MRLAWRWHIHCLKLFNISPANTRKVERRKTLNIFNILSKSARRPHLDLLPTHTGPCFRSTLLHSIITTWNSLPTEVRISKTRGVFSRHIKSHFHRYRFHPRGFPINLFILIFSSFKNCTILYTYCTRIFLFGDPLDLGFGLWGISKKIIIIKHI